MYPSGLEKDLFVEVYTSLIKNPEVEKTPKDTATINQVVYQTAIPVGGTTLLMGLGSFIAAMLITKKPSSRLFLGTVGTILGVPAGMTIAPIEGSLEDLATLPTTLGTKVRQLAVKRLPEDHKLVRLAYQEKENQT